MRYLTVLIWLWSSIASAQTLSKTPESTWKEVRPAPPLPSITAPDTKLRLLGVVLSVGFPEGIGPGISLHPGTNALHVDIAFTSLVSFGWRAGVTFDPFDWVLAPTLTLAGGHVVKGDIPKLEGRYGFNYVNLQLGLEYGRRSRFRLYLRGGYSHLWVQTDKLVDGQTFNGATIHNPSIEINLLPSVNAGVNAYF